MQEQLGELHATLEKGDVGVLIQAQRQAGVVGVSEKREKEIEELEKELTGLGKKVSEYKDKEKRRKPPKFKLDE